MREKGDKKQGRGREEARQRAGLARGARKEVEEARVCTLLRGLPLLGLGEEKNKGPSLIDGPLEIKSWRCSTFPRKNAQYHRRWRA